MFSWNFDVILYGCFCVYVSSLLNYRRISDIFLNLYSAPAIASVPDAAGIADVPVVVGVPPPLPSTPYLDGDVIGTWERRSGSHDI